MIINNKHKNININTNNSGLETELKGAFNLLRGLLYDNTDAMYYLDDYYRDELIEQSKLIPKQFLKPITESINIVKIFYTCMDKNKLNNALQAVDFPEAAITGIKSKAFIITKFIDVYIPDKTSKEYKQIILLLTKFDDLFKCLDIILISPKKYLLRLFVDSLEDLL